ncbi:MAG TPA: hypothetical protein VKX96_06965 [Chloroflexota bacterium]|nr:hypothetical protein [Chloroflexota bacterium]
MSHTKCLYHAKVSLVLGCLIFSLVGLLLPVSALAADLDSATTIDSSAVGQIASSPEFAVEFPSSGAIGFDVSYPQCQASLTSNPPASTTAYQFAVIGITGGRAMTRNRCLGAEYQVAAGQGLPISFYLNVNYPRGAAVAYGQDGPLGTCDNFDEQCISYTYGWNTAQDAYQNAQQTLQSLNVSDMPSIWWLDVEIANYWSPDPSLNDRVIQGAIDFFQQSVGNVTVGIYSVRSDWNRIAGASFQPGVPAWVAGARSLNGAGQLCAQPSFTGGPVALVQYANKQFDVDYVC